jgi:hypothetical protein
MFDKLARFLNLKPKADEKDADAVARFDALHTAFPNDPDRVKAEFDAGHTVAEAIQAMRTQAATELKAAVDEAVALKAQLLQAQNDTATAKKAANDVAKDAAERPAVVVGAAADASADPGAAFDGSKELQSEFGTKAAYLAYIGAAASGRARILQKSKAAE